MTQIPLDIKALGGRVADIEARVKTLEAKGRRDLADRNAFAAALREVIRIRRATNQGSIATRADAMAEVATKALETA